MGTHSRVSGSDYLSIRIPKIKFHTGAAESMEAGLFALAIVNLSHWMTSWNLGITDQITCRRSEKHLTNKIVKMAKELHVYLKSNLLAYKSVPLMDIFMSFSIPFFA